MSRFSEIIEKILKETHEFNQGDVVALKMNPNKVGKIVGIIGKKHGRIYYNVSYPAAIGAYIGNYKFGWINKPIPLDQLTKSSEESLNQKVEEIKLKYECE